MLEVATKQAKSGWTTVAFGDVVRQVKDKVDPEESGLERYVAGEHMDTDDLRIRRWGEIGDGYLGPAFHMRFTPGHVLYGSRRTYLRKVAIADFEGITANTTYVLESADPEVLLQELLPYIMQTEAFNRHSVRESKGSVNPYVNFSDLAWFEFALPPIEEQRRIVRAMESAAALADSLFSLELESRKALTVLAAARFEPLVRGGDMRLLGDICSKKPQSGVYKSEEHRGHGTRMVNMGELFGHDLIDDTVEMLRIDVDDVELTRYRLTSNDLLFGRRSVVLEGAGKCVLVGEHSQPVVFESSVLRATIDPETADSRYVFEWIRSPYGHQQMRRMVTFTTVAGVAGSDVARVPVPIASLETQRRIADELGSLRRSIQAPSRRRAEVRSFSKILLRNLLESR